MYPVPFLVIISASSQYLIAAWIVGKGRDIFFDKSFYFTSLPYLDKNNIYKYTFI